MQSKRIEELDALRGIAALLVLLFHFTMGRPEANLGFKMGTTGVDLFFIISGFVIFMSISKIANSKDFIINRISRLYPTYWAAVTFSFLLIVFISVIRIGNFSEIHFRTYVGNMTMFQFYLLIPDIEQPYWTMIVEMLFYISILFLFHFKLLKYINIIGLTFTILPVILTQLFFDILLVQQIIYWIPLLQFIPLFFAGTIFYKIYSSKTKLVKQYAMLVSCLTCQILLFNYSGRSKDYIIQTEYAAMLFIFFGLFILFVNGKMVFMVSKATLFFGKISFPLYLIHQFISIKIIIPFLTDKLHINFWIASIAVALPVVVLLATGITYFVEIPMGKSMKKKLQTIFLNK